MNQVVVDTNIFLRFLLQDIPQQFDKAKNLFLQAGNGKVELIVPQIVVFEVVFALDKYYQFTKNEIVEKIKILLVEDYLVIQDREVFSSAIELFAQQNMSLPDCFIMALSQTRGAKIATFDEDLNKLLDNNSFMV